jgi:hypothetical protein
MEFLIIAILIVVIGPLLLTQIVLALSAGVHYMGRNKKPASRHELGEGHSLDYLWLQRLNNTLDVDGKRRQRNQ